MARWTPMNRLLAWLKLPHRLEVRLGDTSLSGTRQVFVRLRTRRVRIFYVALATGLGAAVVAMLAGGWRGSFVAPLVLAVVVSEGLTSKRHQLVDELLAQAATRAALDLGREVRPGRWRIEGEQAKAIGLELHRLNQWRPVLDTAAGSVAAQREALLSSSAVGPLRDYLRPSLAAAASNAEPLHVEVASHIDGDPWPTLDQPWPTLHQSDGR
jgi:hypothetical protein